VNIDGSHGGRGLPEPLLFVACLRGHIPLTGERTIAAKEDTLLGHQVVHWRQAWTIPRPGDKSLHYPTLFVRRLTASWYAEPDCQTGKAKRGGQ
jgi:hypothetical protein